MEQNPQSTETGKELVAKSSAEVPVVNGMLTPDTFGGLWRIADMYAKSGMVPKLYAGNPAAVVVAGQYGASIGLDLLPSLQNIAVINGLPTVWGDGQLAIVRDSRTLESFVEFYVGEPFDENYKAVCIAKRLAVGFKAYDPDMTMEGAQKAGLFANEFSVADAKRAGLWGKAGPWQTNPKRMLKMRARAFSLRDGWPDVLKGMHSTEEMDGAEPTSLVRRPDGSYAPEPENVKDAGVKADDLYSAKKVDVVEKVSDPEKVTASELESSSIENEETEAEQVSPGSDEPTLNSDLKEEPETFKSSTLLKNKPEPESPAPGPLSQKIEAEASTPGNWWNKEAHWKFRRGVIVDHLARIGLGIDHPQAEDRRAEFDKLRKDNPGAWGVIKGADQLVKDLFKKKYVNAFSLFEFERLLKMSNGDTVDPDPVVDESAGADPEEPPADTEPDPGDGPEVDAENEVFEEEPPVQEPDPSMETNPLEVRRLELVKKIKIFSPEIIEKAQLELSMKPGTIPQMVSTAEKLLNQINSNQKAAMANQKF